MQALANLVGQRSFNMIDEATHSHRFTRVAYIATIYNATIIAGPEPWSCFVYSLNTNCLKWLWSSFDTDTDTDNVLNVFKCENFLSSVGIFVNIPYCLSCHRTILYRMPRCPPSISHFFNVDINHIARPSYPCWHSHTLWPLEDHFCRNRTDWRQIIWNHYQGRVYTAHQIGT